MPTDNGEIPVRAILRATVLRWKTGLSVAALSSIALLAVGLPLGSTYTAEAVVDWGRIPSEYASLVDAHLRDVNVAETAFRRYLETTEQDHGDCGVTGLMILSAALVIACSAPTPDEARTQAEALARFIETHQAPAFELATRDLDADEERLNQRIDLVEAQLERFENLDASVFEQVGRLANLWDLRAQRLSLQENLRRLEFRRLEIMPTRFRGDVEVVDGPIKPSLRIGLSGILGALLGLFAALVFGVIDLLSVQRRETG